MERVLFLGLVALFAYLVYLIFSPFLLPLVWAVILTIMFFPLHVRIRRRIRQPDRAALVSTLLLTALIVVPALMVMGAFTAQAFELLQWAQAEWRAGRLPLDEVWRRLPIQRMVELLTGFGISESQMTEYITHRLQDLAQFTATQAGLLLRDLLYFIFDLFITLFATFYLFRDGGALLERLRRLLPLDPGIREGLFYIAQNVLYASVISGLVVAAVQGALGGLLFWILGLSAAVLWGIVMAFLSFLPFLGAWLIWIPAGLYLVVKAEYLKAAVLFAAGALVVSTVDNVLRPMLVSGRTQMNGLLVFISILGGAAVFGLVGILLGPILVALGAAVLQYYTTPPPDLHPEVPGPPAAPAG